jgi:2-dehydro-3-deoxyphosphogluconate aldolase / (4S)-4-hydroxy-2-oxoglutarate aldolase
MARTAQEVYNLIEREVIVAGTRGMFPPDVAIKVCGALLEEGIKIFEITMNSVQPIEAMQAVQKEFGSEVCVGMGTVLSVEMARRVIGEGAEFVVSPAFQPDVVKYVLGQDILVAPGVATPSEAVEAWEMGVKLLKIFPIGALGIDYFKAMFGPLDHMKFMCNGGMDADNAREFIQAGAIAVGMAGWLSGDGTWPESRLRSRARVLVNAVVSGQGTAITEE